MPSDLISKIRLPKDSVHDQLQIMRRCRIAMQINAARVFQNAFHLKQANRHHDRIRFHALAMSGTRRRDDVMQGRLSVGDFAMPSEVDIVQRPCVFERRPRRLRPDRRRVCLVGIEGRVKVDQVDAVRIHAAHDVQVVACPHGAVYPVRLLLSHALPLDRLAAASSIMERLGEIQRMSLTLPL